MTNKESGNSLVAIMVVIIIIGSSALLISPNLLPSILWKILAWATIAAMVVFSVILHKKEKKKKALLKKEEERSRQKRLKLIEQEKLQQEQRIEEAKAKLAEIEEKKLEKLKKIKKELEEEANIVWGGRIGSTQKKEDAFKKVVEETNHMPVKVAAGQVVIELNEARRIAEWTKEQINMFIQRPNVTRQARDDARDAIIESIEIKERGGNWTKEKGEELAEKKELARSEAQIEEKRLEDIKDEIESANLKWKAAEARVGRWKGELTKVYASLPKKKNKKDN